MSPDFRRSSDDSNGGAVHALLRTLSSIRLGITLLALIILYSAVGSAVPPFRQYFELTELKYFNHLIFAGLILLFCIVLTTATAVRIAFNRYNAGVLTVHTGLLLLAGGSVLYFGRKIEGDVLLWNPRVQVLSAQRLHGGGGNPVLGQVVAAPGRVWEADMPMLGGRHRIEVTDVRHDGMTTAQEVTLKVSAAADPEPRTVVLRQDAADQRFARLNDQLFLQLVPTNVTDRFYDSNTPALLVRRDGGSPTLFPLDGLPLYHERFDPAPEPILDTAGRDVHPHPRRPLRGIDHWSMPLDIGRDDRAELSDWPIALRIDGYLPYADIRRSPRPGGEDLNPIARVSLIAGDYVDEDWLVARAPRDAYHAVPGRVGVEFVWLDDGAELDQRLTRSVEGSHVLEVRVRDRGVHRVYDVQPGERIAVEGTDYELTVQDLQPDWPLVTAGFEGARTPVARVWVKSPQREFQRSVLQRYPRLNQDRDAQGRKLSERGLVDDNLELIYTDASAPHFLVAASEDSPPFLIFTAPGGTRSRHPLEIGRRLEPAEGVALTLKELIVRPRLEEQPAVVPVEQRRPQPGRQFSLVRLHVRSTKEQWERRVWLRFENYNDSYLDGQPHWARLEVPGVGPMEFLYGRLPRPLPGRLALEQMHVDFYPGGTRPSEWISFIRWKDPHTGAVTRGRAFLNNTARIGPWTLFQSSEAADHESFTILGVGNRDGVMTMLLGCCLVTLGMMYAFYIKPRLKRRARLRAAIDSVSQEVDEAAAAATRPRSPAAAGAATAVILAILAAVAPRAAAQHDGPTDSPQAAQAARRVPPGPESLRAIQDRLHLDEVRSLIVQHNSRYQTLEAWARDVVATIHGRDDFLGLDPVVAAFELMLNQPAYDDLPVVFVKDMALRKHITSHPVNVSPGEARRIVRTGLVSRRYLEQPAVASIINELSGRMTLKRGMDRFHGATSYYTQVLSLFNVIPSPSGRYDSAWHSIDALFASLGMPEGHSRTAGARALPGITPETAANILNDFRLFGRAWLERDADAINAHLASLAEALPGLAPPGTYPTLAQRRMEVVYHRWQALTFGWAFYVAALFASIWALVAGWNWTRRLALGLYGLAFMLHATGIAMRWYIVGRIPVANMFEAVVSSALVGAALAVVLELATRRRVYVLAGSFLGFLSLVLGKFVGSEITQIAPILDDIMLRIHTVLIISSYAIITLAFGVAVCYLVVAARGPRPVIPRVTLGAVSALGLCAVLAYRDAFHALTDLSGWFVVLIPAAFAVTGALLFVYAPQLLPRPALAGVSAPPGSAAIVSASVPVRAALQPQRESVLAAFDLSHMILLHMATIALFVGLVLGAIWADYSWGRPWGWDPKEVFALVTWLFYAILIHVRFVTPRRAMWTAVLSCVGFGAMQFNWWVVNFYIVGLHSYA